jgi:2-phospho-L-lactate/phosphoenolpyruvate guanylyltransferase
MQIHAVVPVKSLDRAKSRLAGLLGLAERRALVLEMLGRVLTTLLACRDAALAEVWVTSADPEVLTLAEGRGVRVLIDHAGDLNGALEQARVALSEVGAVALLVVPADVPLISAEDVVALARLLAEGADVVLAPDRPDEGTNTLGLRLPCALPFRFGEQSAALHRAAAAARGLITRIYRSPTLALDVDDAESLGCYRELLS